MELRKFICFVLISVLPFSSANAQWGGVETAVIAKWLKQAVDQLNKINGLMKDVKNYEDWIKKDLEQNIAKHAPGFWTDLNKTMDEIIVTVNEGQKIANAFAKIDQRYQDIVKGEYSLETDENHKLTNFSDEYDKWSKTTRDSIASALYSVGETNAMFATEAQNIRTLTNLSKNSKGSLQALQVSHLIAKSNVEQLQKLRVLVQAQVKTQAVMFAAESNEEDLKQKLNEKYFNTNRTTVVGDGEKL